MSPQTKLQKKHPRDLKRYAGQWVALAGWKVIACEDSLPKLMESVEKKGGTQGTSVMLVPRKDEGPYILFLKRCR